MRAFCDKHVAFISWKTTANRWMPKRWRAARPAPSGDLNTYSFFFSHHISTMEGGMVLTDDLELYHLLKCMRAHGWTRDIPADSPLYKRGQSDHFEAYRFLFPGYNVRPLEMEAAVGSEQLKKLPAMTAARRKNLALFQSCSRETLIS